VTVELKKKSIKSAFPGEQEKVNSYLSDHKNDFINESFLIGFDQQSQPIIFRER
jgi:hypothetical protein